jgi:hypothetical protein
MMFIPLQRKQFCGLIKDFHYFFLRSNFINNYRYRKYFLNSESDNERLMKTKAGSINKCPLDIGKTFLIDLDLKHLLFYFSFLQLFYNKYQIEVGQHNML